jgi:hypothetical protein
MKAMIYYWICAVTIAISAAGAGVAAQAATRYDGPWRVIITTTRGTCSSGASFGLQVRDGSVYGYGGFGVSGRVSGSGSVYVDIRSGEQHANGSGRLRDSEGRGFWRGVGAQGVCMGYWIANRG